MAIVAMLAALEYRDRTGRGQCIDLSMQDISAWLTQTAWNSNDKAAATHSIIAVRDGYVLAEADDVDLPSLLEMDRVEVAARVIGGRHKRQPGAQRSRIRGAASHARPAPVGIHPWKTARTGRS